MCVCLFVWRGVCRKQKKREHHRGEGESENEKELFNCFVHIKIDRGKTC